MFETSERQGIFRTTRTLEEVRLLTDTQHLRERSTVSVLQQRKPCVQVFSAGLSWTQFGSAQNNIVRKFSARNKQKHTDSPDNQVTSSGITCLDDLLLCKGIGRAASSKHQNTFPSCLIVNKWFYHIYNSITKIGPCPMLKNKLEGSLQFTLNEVTGILGPSEDPRLHNHNLKEIELSEILLMIVCSHNACRQGSGFFGGMGVGTGVGRGVLVPACCSHNRPLSAKLRQFSAATVFALRNFLSLFSFFSCEHAQMIAEWVKTTQVKVHFEQGDSKSAATQHGRVRVYECEFNFDKPDWRCPLHCHSGYRRINATRRSVA